MRKISVISFLLVANLVIVYAQGEIDDQKKIFFRNERTFAGIINTEGYGFGFRYAKRLDGFKKSTYELELSYVKDEEETKVSKYYSQQIGSSFVPGKVNAFFTLRAGVGFQKELFQKYDRGGISIRYFYNFGPVLGILKPIYYEVTTNDTVSKITVKKFELDEISNIEGRAPFYLGLDEISLVPGLYGKFGFTFEFGRYDKTFSAIETGVALNIFTKKVPIMADNDNKFAYFTFFLSYRFGKIIDAQFKDDINKVDELLNN